MYIVIVVCLAYLYLSLLISLRILMRNKKNSLDSMSTLYLYRRYRSLFDSKQENACKIGVFFQIRPIRPAFLSRNFFPSVNSVRFEFDSI